jgi:hypothetical protein
MQRIGYPLLVHVAALGRPGLVPAMMVVVNLLALAALAATVRAMQLRHALPDWFSLAVIVWPGFLVTTMHDTTELVASALMAGSLACLLSGRIAGYAMLVAAASLTRETSVLLAGGVAAAAAIDNALAIVRLRRWTGLINFAWCVAAMIPFLAWRWAVTLRWGMTPGQSGATQLGWPGVGLISQIGQAAGAAITLARSQPVTALNEAVVALSLIGFVGLLALVISRIGHLRQADWRTWGVVAGWAMVAALHLCLIAYVYAEPLGYLRTCSEIWVLSMIVLALTGWAMPRQWVRPALLFGAIALASALR